jgi:predicted MPP superfamily phosphohydrolase
MNFIKDAYIKFLSLFNYPYISKEILSEIKGPVLLHISDTPEDIYNYIFRIVDILKPQVIIHTGDMADNIKLGIHKYKTDNYYKGIKRFIGVLEKKEFSKIYYVLGNHDDYDMVSKVSKKGTILKEGILTIGDYNFTVSHYHKDSHTDFSLYGHSFEPGHYNKNGTIGLNGLLNINIIDLSNKRIFYLEYPVGTNGSRRMELKRIGL